MTAINKENVIYSFKGKWLQPILDGKVKAFFRKRFPRDKPSRVYFYVGAPTSAIIGWAEVCDLERIEARAALGMTAEGAIDRIELAEYLEGAETVGVFKLSPPRIFSSPLSVSDVRRTFNFHPPQNFVQIDEEDASKLDGLAK
ncbi:hypothetical protein [Cereibacter sphaeroides]|jgi:predicted transcriptional regulator|uniref:hypothetical protein n=1 Tax=Cereibacter sphaeroides TaxID=1063 RepID=UPI0000F29D00|nr:hypothetical protein Rsph17029_1847 [Cereibacter sphaeroides ATCC 17029]